MPSAVQPSKLGHYIAANADLVRLRETGSLTICRGDGVRVYDSQGREYIEALSGLGCVSLGFSEQRLIAAAEKQMRQLPYYHSFAGRTPAIAMELIPRISRAQSMDALSSQANLAGYKAVLVAANSYGRILPQMMTPGGTLAPSRSFIMGVGVAGLQAIATAKRLGAVIEASDVRPAVKEQVESLGAKFVDVPCETDEERECAEGVGVYARPMPASWMERQAKAVHERAKQADIVITTALIPGRNAPTLLHEATVAEMKPGSVVIDLAAAQGGNCPLTEADQVVVKHGVTLVGYSNLAALVPAKVLGDTAKSLTAGPEVTIALSAGGAGAISQRASVSSPASVRAVWRS